MGGVIIDTTINVCVATLVLSLILAFVVRITGFNISKLSFDESQEDNVTLLLLIAAIGLVLYFPHFQTQSIYRGGSALSLGGIDIIVATVSSHYLIISAFLILVFLVFRNGKIIEKMFN